MSRFRELHDGDGGEGSIDMSPLIDCVFILLIFFIVTTTFVEETGVEIDRPQAASAIQLEKTSILIALTERGEVIYGGRDVGVGGVQSLVRRLIQKEDLPVILQADAASPTGMLIRVLDEARLAGATRVSVASAARSG